MKSKRPHQPSQACSSASEKRTPQVTCAGLCPNDSTVLGFISCSGLVSTILPGPHDILYRGLGGGSGKYVHDTLQQVALGGLYSC